MRRWVERKDDKVPPPGARRELRIDQEGDWKGAVGDGGERRNDKPTPFLGVVSSPVPPPLAAQLDLAEGFGLVVEDVLPGSPAEKAGVKRFDVLKLLNDQQLTSPEQLTVLIRGLGKDADASLTVLRKGQEQKISMKVGERLASDRREGFDEAVRRVYRVKRFDDNDNGQADIRLQIARSQRDSAEQMARAQKQLAESQERLRDYQNKFRDFQGRLKDWQSHPDREIPKLPEFQPIPKDSRPGDARPLRPADVLRDRGPGKRNEVRTDRGQEDSRRSSSSHARVVMRDQDGELEVVVKDGKRMLIAKSPKGDEIFNGPVDTPEQRESVPEPFRKKLDSLRTSATPDGAELSVGGSSSSSASASVEVDNSEDLAPVELEPGDDVQ